jgi:hypothetical protein
MAGSEIAVIRKIKNQIFVKQSPKKYNDKNQGEQPDRKNYVLLKGATMSNSQQG